MHWFGWKWSADTKWNAVLLRGAVASDGVHGPRACAFWRYIVSDCRYDWTRGFSLFLSLHLCSFFTCFLFYSSAVYGKWWLSYICRLRDISHYEMLKEANFLEMFSIFFSISTNLLLSRRAIHFSYGR